MLVRLESIDQTTGWVHEFPPSVLVSGDLTKTRDRSEHLGVLGYQGRNLRYQRGPFLDYRSEVLIALFSGEMLRQVCVEVVHQVVRLEVVAGDTAGRLEHAADLAEVAQRYGEPPMIAHDRRKASEEVW
jgi:hypothetical protein